MFRKNMNIEQTSNRIFCQPNDGMSIWEAPSLGLKALLFYSKVKFAKPLLLCIGAFYMFSFGYYVYGKSIRRNNTSGIVYMADQVAHFLLTLSNLSTISICFRFKTYNKSLWKLFWFIHSSKNNKNIFRDIGIAISITCLIAAGCDIYFWVTYQGWKSLQFYVLRNLQFGVMNFTLYSIAEVAYYIKVMFSDVNEQLLSIYSECFKIDQKDLNLMLYSRPNCKVIHLCKRTNRVSLIHRITNHHNQLNNIVDDFNAVFGLVLFMATLNLVSNIVWPLTMIVEFNIPLLLKIYGTLDVPVSCNISNMTMNMLWIILMIGHAILIGCIGGSLASEAQITSRHCYKIMHQQRLAEQDEEEIRIKHVLTSLVKQAEAQCPVLNADGYFTLNLNILGMVASNVFAYTIVIIQFVYNNAKSKIQIQE